MSKLKKGNKWSLALAALVLVLLLGIGLYTAVTYYPSETKSDSMSINIYFVNPTSNGLEAEQHAITRGDEESMTLAVLTKLLEGPKETNLVKSIPSEVRLDDVIITADHVAEVSLSTSYKSLTPQQELFCRAALVWTLTGLEFIDNVHIYIGNEELLSLNGQPLGLLNRENVVITDDVLNVKTEKRTVKLYFSDTNAMYLVTEEREIEINPNQPIERSLMEELLKGPIEETSYRTIPIETVIIDITTGEGICFVNLNADFMNKFLGGSSSEELMLYSIVDTLTELSYVTKVQFLIEGNKIAESKGGFDLSKPLERNADLIQ